ncbi:hypothetical protein BCR33DRAFT_717218 [Rhizoclosmatium globosum]|uniref:Uncharacterized protein n=1 Tax=Rhizoclosmatium globosum TaxID=329046 RepID=A0A1Y2CAR9_9FUNG|nr:hypothetical protein BCR33DRAFT_717218 [Rhizoclosmatium globosum]|eukprot:ORY44132.1 hypothetical protein BCR33DRAFT_717218 [Rhizoclosmatium globosum]
MLSVGWSRCVKKVVWRSSLREEGGLAIDNAALEILNVHDVCDAILMGLGWFQFARATFEASGNPI